MDKKGSKFNYDSYALKNDQVRPFTQTFSQRNCKRICVCSNYNESKCFQCFKCKQKIHNCTRVQINRPQIPAFQCLSCLARSMDLIYQPQTILLQTFFRTQNIFQKPNSINFEFTLKFEQTNFPIDVRCFKGNKIQLVWPMQGEFYLNGQTVPAFTLKPLKSNSNRKNRKQENFLIQPELLKEGLNVLTFKIPRLQKGKFIDAFQYEQTGIYYLALYSVKQLTNQQVLNITQRQRRHQKPSTLALFHLGDQQLPTQKQKIRLIDPYTCQRIKFPVRGRYCKHVSTICLLTYIQFQKRSRSWKCPICAVEVGSFLNEPYLDVWMYEILKEKDKGDSVVVYANGMYEWDEVEKKVMSLSDSDSDEMEQRQKQNASQVEHIIQQQPLVLALQNIELQSHPSQQPPIVSQQVDLCEYDYVIDYNNDQCQDDLIQEQLIENNPLGSDGNAEIQIFEDERQDIGSQGGMFDGIRGEGVTGVNMIQDEGRFGQHQSIVADVVIDDYVDNQHQNDGSRISSSNSEFQELAPQNKFVPPSIISNIIPTTPLVQQKPSQKAPQIYSTPLQTKQKLPLPNYLIQGSSIIEKQLSKLKKHQQQVLNYMMGEKTNKIIIPNKFPLPKPSKPTTKISIQNQQIIHENKRLLQRPTLADQLENLKKEKSLSLPNQRHQPINFGKMNRKNIEISQSLSLFKTTQPKSFKVEPKTEYKPFNQIFPFQKTVEKEEPQQEKSKVIKIKTMKFYPISYSKFVKHYCNIPIPPLTRKMNEDMKRLFRNILEVN